jgi:hypothetical protein
MKRLQIMPDLASIKVSYRRRRRRRRRAFVIAAPQCSSFSA